MNENQTIMMGKLAPSWSDGTAKSITFCVTEECNLSCKYCYMTGKNHNKKMTFETAKSAVDFILSNRTEFPEPSIIWDFIGGEPFIEIDLIDKICDYIKQQMYVLDHPWFNSYRFSFSTNGLLYHTKKVQDYINKNRGHLSIGMSVDGNKIKHDLQRVNPDGSGSYDDVVKNVPLWLKQFPGSSTKATFSHGDLPYLKDSIIHLWSLGINIVSANVVFEDVWEEGDDEIIESQLRELADYVLENQMWKEYSVRFFDPKIGFPLPDEHKTRNFCGAGKMLAIDCSGNFFPCIRFYDFSLNNRSGMVIGDITRGIDHDKVRPFLALTLTSQSRKECIDCEVATGCSWCQGCNYDLADTDTIYQRATCLCKIHKATVRANKYFWDEFEKITGLPSERQRSGSDANLQEQHVFLEKFMQFITSDSITPHCSYRNTRDTGEVMSEKVFNKGMEFCQEKGFIPVMLGRPDYAGSISQEGILYIENAEVGSDDSIAVYDNRTGETDAADNSILIVNKDNLQNLYHLVTGLSGKCSRVNLVLEGIEHWADKETEEYKKQLDMLVSFIADTYKRGSHLELSVLADIWNLRSMRNCEAGQNSFALAPNGKIYMCPAFYFDDEKSFIGTLEKDIFIKNPQLLELENAPICSACDVYSCRRCKYLNRKMTNEFNTPSKIQCLVGHIERNKSMELQRLVKQYTSAKFENTLREIDYMDPLEKVLRKEVL